MLIAMDVTSAQVQLWLTLMVIMGCWGNVFGHQRPLWHEPCAQGTVTDQMEYKFHRLGEPSTEAEIAGYRRELVTELRNARSNARRVERYIMRHRFFQSPLLVRDCQNTPSLLGMPQIEVTHELFGGNLHSTLPYDFQRLATLAVFMSEISGDRPISSVYQTRLDSLLGHVRKSMCLTEIVALSNQQTITRDVTEHVMPTMYTNLPSQSLRDMRNCLIARDASQMFDNLHEWYSQWVG